MATATQEAGITVLSAAVESYRSSVSSNVSPIAHDSAAINRLEQALQLGVFVHDLAKSVVNEWADAVRSGRREFRLDDAKVIRKIRVTWLQVCDQVLSAVSELESNSVKVGFAEQFRLSVRDCRLNDFDVDDAMVAIANLQQGRGVLLNEAMSELRDRARHQRN